MNRLTAALAVRKTPCLATSLFLALAILTIALFFTPSMADNNGQSFCAEKSARATKPKLPKRPGVASSVKAA